MSRLGRIVAVAILASAVYAVPAHATQPEAQSIELNGQIASSSTVVGTWTAAGFVEDSGTYVETFRFAGETVHVEKVLVGSKGTIVLRAQAVIVWTDSCTVMFEAGSWQFAGGTGAYERLNGGGSPATASDSFGNLCTGEVQVRHTGRAHAD